MMYDYIELPDGTQIAYSNIQPDNTVQVGVERPVDFGFDSARCTLPAYKWTSVEGFSDEQIKWFEELIRNNAPLIYRLAHEAEKQYA